MERSHLKLCRFSYKDRTKSYPSKTNNSFIDITVIVDDMTAVNRHPATLLDKVFWLRWFGNVERMSVFLILHNVIHARYEGGRNKGRLILCWIENINEDIIKLRVNIKGVMSMTNDRQHV